jgi:hypothetical protein
MESHCIQPPKHEVDSRRLQGTIVLGTSAIELQSWPRWMMENIKELARSIDRDRLE